MKNELMRAFLEGFKDCFRLAAGLFVAVASVIAAFEKREMNDPQHWR